MKYFSDDKFTLYLGDSFRVLGIIEEKTIDMIFADPPYFLSNNGISCQAGKMVSVNKASWDATAMTATQKINYYRKWLSLCSKVLKDNGTIWISGTMHNIYYIGVALEYEGFSIINNVTWKKTNPVPNISCRAFTHSTETILWARKQLTKSKRGKHFFNYTLMKEDNNNKQMKDVWDFSTVPKSEKKYGKHPTQKPLSLLLRIIKASTQENDLVLDPFNGSGTTGIASTILNRKYIGIDNVVEYLELSQKRYEEIKNEKRKKF
ncbi:MAG: site-specific DNA-methyltransferase [Clostridia bacterium]|nr:site-specific DNA-methyltransferase [Clostridia bacterium]